MEILRDRCVGCGLCAGICPQNAIALDGENIAVIGEACTLCGSCADQCPAKAVRRSGPPAGKVLEMDVSHLADCRDIWVVAELREGEIAGCTFELLGEARRLAAGGGRRVAAVLLCREAGELPRRLIQRGADLVYLVQDPIFEHFSDRPYQAAVARLVREERPLALLLSATAMGRSLAPRLAANLRTGLTADCTRLELCPNGLLIQTRPAFGGNLYASLLCPRTWPQMSTVRAKVMQPLPADPARRGRVVERRFQPDSAGALARVIERLVRENEATVDEAEIVVTAGFGAATERGLALVRELASVLGGALGASRKVVDAGLISYERQVGQTGKTVGPKLYIACGVSGAIQHVVGMSSAKTVVALNLDPNAQIFHVADVGVVCDLCEFLPGLIAALRERRAAGEEAV